MSDNAIDKQVSHDLDAIAADIRKEMKAVRGVQRGCSPSKSTLTRSS